MNEVVCFRRLGIYLMTFLNTCFLRFLCGAGSKVTGPDGSSYWASHEAHIGGSDADDA